jgi:ubiquitin-conjugating enzyme E2 A
MSDLKTVKQQPPEGVSASPLSEENLYVWGATVFGPDDTSWEGGIYTMRLMFTEQYPDKPPRVRFTTEMVRSRPPLTRGWGRVKDKCGSDLAALPPQFHPNIYPDGTLCLDLIQDNWSPIYSVSSILIAIRSLLTDPNCASPANPEAAHLYQTDRKQYGRKVRRIAEKSVS